VVLVSFNLYQSVASRS